VINGRARLDRCGEKRKLRRAEGIMAEELQSCCVVARDAYVQRLSKVANYPVIKEVPCPACRRMIAIRMYAPPTESNERA